MSQNITDVDAFTDPVVVPSNGEDATAASLLTMAQALANRARYLYNRIGTIPTLAANRVLARASTGVTEGKPSTDFTLAMLALSTAVAWLDALTTKAANIAAAATTNIAGATGALVHVTGADVITALGTAAAGVRRVVVFDSSGATLTHNATSLILPYGRSILTQVGDVAVAVSEGGGNWRIESYQRKGGECADADTSSAFYGYAGNPTFTGSGNAGFGVEALLALTAGDHNVALGNFALGNLTTGDDNIVIGQDAGGSLITGSRNILLSGDTPAADTNDHLNIAGVLFGDLDNGVFRIGGSGAVTPLNDEVLQLDGNLMFLESAADPEIFQGGDGGNDLTVRAQDGSGKSGGDLHLLGGIGTTDGGTFVGRDGGALGFFEGAGDVKQTVSGSTVDGTALQSLLDALVAYGLINDVTNDS
jgi:hypothetical protein